MRGIFQIWTWCWCWAIWKFSVSDDKALVFVKTKRIPFVAHAFVVDRSLLSGMRCTEASPLGEKHAGLRGIWHALTGKWVVCDKEID